MLAIFLLLASSVLSVTFEEETTDGYLSALLSSGILFSPSHGPRRDLQESPFLNGWPAYHPLGSKALVSQQEEAFFERMLSASKFGIDGLIGASSDSSRGVSSLRPHSDHLSFISDDSRRVKHRVSVSSRTGLSNTTLDVDVTPFSGIVIVNHEIASAIQQCSKTTIDFEVLLQDDTDYPSLLAWIPGTRLVLDSITTKCSTRMYAMVLRREVLDYIHSDLSATTTFTIRYHVRQLGLHEMFSDDSSIQLYHRLDSSDLIIPTNDHRRAEINSIIPLFDFNWNYNEIDSKPIESDLLLWEKEIGSGSKVEFHCTECYFHLAGSLIFIAQGSFYSGIKALEIEVGGDLRSSLEASLVASSGYEFKSETPLLPRTKIGHFSFMLVTFPIWFDVYFGVSVAYDLQFSGKMDVSSALWLNAKSSLGYRYYPEKTTNGVYHSMENALEIIKKPSIQASGELRSRVSLAPVLEITVCSVAPLLFHLDPWFQFEANGSVGVGSDSSAVSVSSTANVSMFWGMEMTFELEPIHLWGFDVTFDHTLPLVWIWQVFGDSGRKWHCDWCIPGTNTMMLSDTVDEDSVDDQGDSPFSNLNHYLTPSLDNATSTAFPLGCSSQILALEDATHYFLSKSVETTNRSIRVCGWTNSETDPVVTMGVRNESAAAIGSWNLILLGRNRTCYDCLHCESVRVSFDSVESSQSHYALEWNEVVEMGPDEVNQRSFNITLGLHRSMILRYSKLLPYDSIVLSSIADAFHQLPLFMVSVYGYSTNDVVLYSAVNRVFIGTHRIQEFIIAELPDSVQLTDLAYWDVEVKIISPFEDMSLKVGLTGYNRVKQLRNIAIGGNDARRLWKAYPVPDAYVLYITQDSHMAQRFSVYSGQMAQLIRVPPGLRSGSYVMPMFAPDLSHGKTYFMMEWGDSDSTFSNLQTMNIRSIVQLRSGVQKTIWLEDEQWFEFDGHTNTDYQGYIRTDAACKYSVDVMDVSFAVHATYETPDPGVRWLGFPQSAIGTPKIFFKMSPLEGQTTPCRVDFTFLEAFVLSNGESISKRIDTNEMVFFGVDQTDYFKFKVSGSSSESLGKYVNYDSKETTKAPTMSNFLTSTEIIGGPFDSNLLFGVFSGKPQTLTVNSSTLKAATLSLSYDVGTDETIPVIPLRDLKKDGLNLTLVIEINDQDSPQAFSNDMFKPTDARVLTLLHQFQSESLHSLLWPQIIGPFEASISTILFLNDLSKLHEFVSISEDSRLLILRIPVSSELSVELGRYEEDVMFGSDGTITPNLFITNDDRIMVTSGRRFKIQVEPCDSGCNDHGSCNATFDCACEDNWGGMGCEISLCNNRLDGCLNGGTCKPDHQCSCIDGFSGDDCSVKGAGNKGTLTIVLSAVGATVGTLVIVIVLVGLVFCLLFILKRKPRHKDYEKLSAEQSGINAD